MFLPYFLKYYLNSLLNHLNWLPTNINISYLWNGGSFLGIISMIQIISGLILSLLFTPTTTSFWILFNLTEEINLILFLRWIHSNGASIFFLLIFFHMARGMYFYSFKKKKIWLSGVSIYILLMAAAFLGYVLPWGQMSLWGGTVITNLFGVLSNNLVLWMWGNFSISSPTLSLFFSLHFLIPFILFIFVFIHIIFLHETGSSSKLFISSFKNKFVDYFLFKDSINMYFFIIMFSLIFISPWMLGDPENFIEANNLLSPIHIKPEWYFLWAYAILRAIPSKTGGVLALFLAVILFYLIIFKKKKSMFILNKFFTIFIMIFFFLTILGGCPVEIPFIFISQLFSFLYFLYLLIYYVNKYKVLMVLFFYILFLILIFLVLILLSVAFYTLFERKIMSINQLRVGPMKLLFLGLGQPIIDGFKLFLKFLNPPQKTNFFFFLSPILSFLIMTIFWSSFFFFNIFLKVFFFLILFGISVYSFVLSGWSSFSKFGYLGGLRASSQTVSYEVSLTIILISILFLLKNLHIFLFGESIFFFFLPIVFLWFISILVETNRAPFDFSEGESELISGFNIEYGSSGFVLFFLAEYSMMIFLSILTCLIFSLNFFFFFMLLLGFIIMRTSFPRFRYDFLLFLFWMKLLPISIMIFMIIILF